MIERTKTGITKLDEILGGGIPKGNTVLITGGPGTGKTLLAWQFLYNGATKFGEPGIFLTLEERPKDMRRNLSNFGWNIEKLEDENMIAIIDASTPKIGIPSRERYVETKPVDIDSLMYKVHRISKDIKAQRFVLDSIPALGFRMEEEHIRDSIFKLNALLLEIGCTSLLTSERVDPYGYSRYRIAEYIAHGLISLDLVEKKGELKRSLVVVKMRGTKHSMKIYPFEITENGIEVISAELF